MTIHHADKLVQPPRQRHHALMISTHTHELNKLAEQLQDNEIHVWHLAYQPATGRTAMRAVLAAYLGVHPSFVDLVDGEYGRPALARQHDQGLGFNWSHSGHHALMAVGRDILPGIDVELRRPRARAMQIAQRFFSSEEVDALFGLPEAAREQAFLRLWTAKEAVVKALGRGLAFGLDRLSVGFVDQQLALTRLEGESAQDWQLHALPIAPELTAAIAWRGEARRISLGVLASSA